MSGASEIYHQDFHAWAMRNAELIRQGRLAEVDGEHVAEELESMGKSQQRALGSQLTGLVAHLLKWRHQPGGRGASWRNTITLQRIPAHRTGRTAQGKPQLAPHAARHGARRLSESPLVGRQ